MRPRTFSIYPPLERQFAGPLTFAGHLRNHLQSNGWAHRDAVDEGLGVLIVFVMAPFALLRRARALGIPILLRLDGLYYGRKHGLWHKEYLKTNLRVWCVRRFFADAIVYQSRFSWNMVDHLLGRSGKPARVIHNGISLPPASAGGREETASDGAVRFVATGRFRGDDMLPPTIRALDLCAGKFPFTLDVYGAVDEAWKPWLDRPYVRAHGKRPNAEVRALLPRYDALLFTQTSPSCPNVVIEAVASGLPVIAYATGSVPELLSFNRDLIAETPRRLLHGSGDFDAGRFAACLERFHARRGEYRTEAARHTADFSEEKTIALYRETLEGLREGK